MGSITAKCRIPSALNDKQTFSSSMSSDMRKEFADVLNDAVMPRLSIGTVTFRCDGNESVLELLVPSRQISIL